MILVIVEDVVQGLATAQNIYKIAFRNAGSESQLPYRNHPKVNL